MLGEIGNNIRNLNTILQARKAYLPPALVIKEKRKRSNRSKHLQLLAYMYL
jgi:hypothetical protein